MKEFVPKDTRLVMCLSSNITYLFCWVLIDISEDISCLHAEARLHSFVIFMT